MYGNCNIDSFMRRPEQPTSRTIHYYLSTRTQKVPTKTRNIPRRIQPTRTPPV